MVIISMFVIVISVVCLSAIQITNYVYDKQLLNLSSKMLNLYTTTIENELRKMDKLTFSLLTEGRTQDNLVKINSIPSSYERYQAITELRTKLLGLSQSESYITSVSYFDEKGREYTVGNSVSVFNGIYLKKVRDTLDLSSGEITWIEPMEGDSSFVVARKLRTVGQLQSVGYILVRIDPEWLIKWVSGTWSDFRGELLIYTDNYDEIYKNPSLQSLEFDPGLLKDGKYNIQNINGSKYLVTDVNSNYTGWSYYTLVSYDHIFNSISLIRMTLFIIFVILMVILFIVGVKFSGSITTPIINLSKRMKKVENGEFELTGMSCTKQDSGDEVIQLHNDFLYMINKINSLIKENYLKQLLIKEAEIKALQSQINPHFLYNTLESINWEARINKQHKISTMVKALGDILRKATQTSNHVTTIGEELKLVQAYITIQSFRYEERLEFEVICEDHLREKEIVKMSLQPIVENSIKYGLERKAGICQIKVLIEGNGEWIKIDIIDNGPGMKEKDLVELQKRNIKTSGTGIGLKNIDDRIKLSFGDQYGLTIHSQETIGTCVTLIIPYRGGS